MGTNSLIGWTHHTLNPWHGCDKLTAGCKHCYAEVHDLRRQLSRDLHWGAKAPRLFASKAHMALPLRWNRKAARLRRRQRVFCMSMGDLFELHQVPLYAMLQANYRADVFELVEQTPWLDWMLLTKRVENIAPMLPARWRLSMPPNVWIGASIENQEQADARLPVLLDTVYRELRGSVSVVFLSCEPLLSDIDLASAAPGYDMSHALDLVIAGEESGNKARPADLDWFRSLRDQCLDFKISFYFKQLFRGSKKLLSPHLDGKRWLQIPESVAIDERAVV